MHFLFRHDDANCIAFTVGIKHTDAHPSSVPFRILSPREQITLLQADCSFVYVQYDQSRYAFMLPPHEKKKKNNKSQKRTERQEWDFNNAICGTLWHSAWYRNLLIFRIFLIYHCPDEKQLKVRRQHVLKTKAQSEIRRWDSAQLHFLLWLNGF